MNPTVQIFSAYPCVTYTLGFLCILGCGKPQESSSPTAVVTGTVSFQGSPLSLGSILFQHSSGKTVSADIQCEGSYRIDALQGNNAVAIVSREPDRENPQGRPRVIPGKDLIPAMFGDFRSSRLSATVAAENNQIDFELSDDAAN